MNPQVPPRDRLIAEIAARQYGLVTRRQLLAKGLTPDQIGLRIGRGQLHPIHRGIYAAGTPLLLPGARELAAVLACQPDAYSSHRSAAHILGLLALPPSSATVEVTVGARDVRRAGIWVHRAGRLGRDEAGEIDDIPVTSPARTILDLSGRVGAETLEQIVAEAHAHRMLKPGELVRLLDRHRHRRGIAPLRALVEGSREPKRTRSKAERQLLTVLRERRLPEPASNVFVGRYEVDLCWPAERLVVELDSFRFHSSRAAFETDRRRDQYLTGRGYLVLRVTWLQLTREPEAVVDRVAAVLIRCRARAPARAPRRASPG